MAKNNDRNIFGSEGSSEQGGESEAVLRTLTAEQIKKVDLLIELTGHVKTAQETLKENYEEIAKDLGVKPAELKELVTVVIKEREEGGVLDAKQRRLDWVRVVVEQVTKNDTYLKGSEQDRAQQAKEAT